MLVFKQLSQLVSNNKTKKRLNTKEFDWSNVPISKKDILNSGPVLLA
jgi:hypothetical protein